MALPTSSRPQPLAAGGKAVEDTMEGCLARAAADLARAAGMDTRNGRARRLTYRPSR